MPTPSFGPPPFVMLNQAIPPVISSPTNAAVSPVEAVMAQNRQTTAPTTQMLRFPSETIQYGTLFRFVKYSYDNQSTNTKLITNVSGASIALPLPQSLMAQMGISYAQLDSGVIGYAMKAGSSVVEGLEHGNLNNGQDFVNAVKKVGSVTATSAAYVIRRAAAEFAPGTEGVADQILGSVTNPYNVATFQHSDTRSYGLSFLLIPESPQDSTTIKNICDAFVYHSLPSRGGLPGSAVQNQPLFLDMPDEVEISYYGSTFLNMFARAVITNVAVNYAPLGAPSFFGGTSAPTAVQLNLSISEIQQLTRESFADAGAGAHGTDAVAAADASSGMFQPQTLGASL